MVTGSTYYYEIQSYRDAGSSALSDPTTGITIIVSPTAAPSILTNSSSDGQVSFTWSAVAATPASPVLGYKVQRYNPGTSSWTTLYTGTALSYTDTGLTNGLSYTYIVAAYNSIGTGASGYAYGYPLALPATPSGLTASVSGSSILLSWAPVASSSAAPVWSYYIHRAFSPAGPFTLMDATGPASASTYTASSQYVSTGQIYYFEIAAVGNAGASAQSSPTAGVTITNAPTATPTITLASGSNTQIALSWTATGTSSAPITGYILQRSTTSATGPWSTIYSGAAASYTDTGLTNGSGYYHVAATNSNGTGPYSSSAGAAPLGAPLSPTPVTQQAIGDVNTPYVILVNWTPVLSVYSPTFGYTSQTNGYNVYSSFTQSGPYTLLATVTGQVNQSYTVPSPTVGSTYYFKVASYGPGGESAQVTVSPSSEATVPSLPITAPTLTATAQSGPQVLLSWTSVASTPEYPASSSYQLQTASSPSGPWSDLRGYVGNSYTDVYTDYGTTHYYRVAVQSTGTAYGGHIGPYSAVQSATLNVGSPFYADTLAVSSTFSGGANIVPTYNTLNGAATNTYSHSDSLQ